MEYKSAGVDIDAGNETVRRITSIARATFTRGVLSEIGSFGGLFQLDRDRYREPVLVSSADGVGTKLKVAFMTGRHDTIGADLVNHCVNDILVQGAEPLFFLDYLATGRLSPSVAEQVVTGVARGCRENGCALIGGETAEMPGFYPENEYDLAGTIVGWVRRRNIISGDRIRPGDAVVGLASAGLHTNGYSLARKVLLENSRLKLDEQISQLGCTLGKELLRPHRGYWPLLRPLIKARSLKGLAHITGGGLTENPPRILPAGCALEIKLGSWPVPPIFPLIERLGSVPQDDMLRTFNMGIGMVLIVAEDQLPAVGRHLRKSREKFWIVGRVARGRPGVTYV